MYQVNAGTNTNIAVDEYYKHFFFLCPTVNSDNLAGDLRCGESGNQAPSIPGLWSPCRIPCCLLTAEKSKRKSEAS